jgi:hypothetical protein
MIEAVENHMPEVVVIDEIGTEQEALAARTIAERGVQLIGTAHGTELRNLLVNPTLSDLVGGIQAVTLGDEEARRRGTRKTVLERKGPPTFDVLVELMSHDEVVVYSDVAAAVDVLLREEKPAHEHRTRDADGVVHSEAVRSVAALRDVESGARPWDDQDDETWWWSEARSGRGNRNGGRRHQRGPGRYRRAA